MDKVIAIVGVLDSPVSTNLYMARAFKNIGYKVLPINYRTLIQGMGFEFFYDYTQHIISKHSPEFTILCKINGVDPDFIDVLNKYTKTFYWFMDNIEVAKAIGAEHYVAKSNIASATSSEVVELFEKYNTHSYQIIEGFPQDIYYKEENITKTNEVIFFGNATKKRITFMEHILPDIDVKIYGVGWPEEFKSNEPIFLSKLRSEINKSKIVLNLVHSNIFSDRVVTTLGCGTFMLSEYCNDLSIFFNKEQHLDWFNTIEECKDLIQVYLNDDEKRETIAEQGMEKVRRLHTWGEVVRKILWAIK
ncbi:MAG: glycosyltransferase family protein [Candidatus Heimdallarchaeaceae archaeon]